MNKPRYARLLKNRFNEKTRKWEQYTEVINLEDYKYAGIGRVDNSKVYEERFSF